MGGKIIDLSGQTFGRWTVLGYAGRSRWNVRCDCGVEVTLLGHNLRRGSTRSCGCLQFRHGEGKGTRLYNIWIGMRGRCLSPTIACKDDYGGRGIGICAEWSDYAVFRDWALANGYRDDLTIDRYPDVDGWYELGNCRWATRKQQSNNRRPRRWWKRPQDSSAL